MANIVLKVTPEVLQSTAQNIETILKNIDKQFANIERTIKASRRYWEGDASDAHLRYYESYKDEIEKMRKELMKDKENLLEISGVYRDTESAAVKATNILSSDVIN